jgi:hypothetical protein
VAFNARGFCHWRDWPGLRDGLADVVAVRLTDGATTIFNTLCSSYHKLVRATTCSQQRSGIWGRGGAVVDPDASMSGRIYVTTGNGDFDVNQGGDDYGDSVIALPSDLSEVLGTYTPADYHSAAAQPTGASGRR